MIRLVVIAGLATGAGCLGGASKSSSHGGGPGGAGGQPDTTTAPGSGSDATKTGDALDPQTRCHVDPNISGTGECPSGSRLPEVFDGEPTTVGAIDKTVVRRVVRENFAVLRYCYESTLLANPDIGGTVVMGFKIEIDGTVHDVTASGVHPDLEACLIAKVRGFRFPRPDGAKVEVSYPLTFKPS